MIKKLEGENKKLKVQKKGADAEIATENVTENAAEKARNHSTKKAKNCEKRLQVTTQQMPRMRKAKLTSDKPVGKLPPKRKSPR